MSAREEMKQDDVVGGAGWGYLGRVTRAGFSEEEAFQLSCEKDVRISLEPKSAPLSGATMLKISPPGMVSCS